MSSSKRAATLDLVNLAYKVREKGEEDAGREKEKEKRQEGEAGRERQKEIEREGE